MHLAFCRTPSVHSHLCRPNHHLKDRLGLAVPSPPADALEVPPFVAGDRRNALPRQSPPPSPDPGKVDQIHHSPNQTRRCSIRISLSRIPPSRVDFCEVEIPPSPSNFMHFSSHHNFITVAPICACSTSKCSSRRVHHFISLHHFDLSSS